MAVRRTLNYSYLVFPVAEHGIS